MLKYPSGVWAKLLAAADVIHCQSLALEGHSHCRGQALGSLVLQGAGEAGTGWEWALGKPQQQQQLAPGEAVHSDGPLRESTLDLGLRHPSVPL